MNNPLVSILVVTYNSEKFIKDALKSILNQSYSNIEIVISDDCSTDNTWNIVKEYGDTRIRAYRNAHNIGEYPNRNRCISLAKGKYIVFIDGDDTITKDGLSVIIPQMEAYPAVGMGLARPAEEFFIRPSLLTSYELMKMHYFGKTILDRSFARNIFNTGILKNTGGLSEKYKSGDNFVRLRIASQYDCLVVSDGLGLWRKRPGQATEKIKNDIRGWIEPFEINFFFLKENTVFNRKERNSAFLILLKTMFRFSLSFAKGRKFNYCINFQLNIVKYLILFLKNGR